MTTRAVHGIIVYTTRHVDNGDVHFLSRTFCLAYAYDFLRAYGTGRWFGRTYSGMGQLRIAQELWFHAVAYYVGKPFQIILKTCFGISWKPLNILVDKAEKMEINSNDDRAPIFAFVWMAGFIVKKAIRNALGYIPGKIAFAIL